MNYQEIINDIKSFLNSRPDEKYYSEFCVGITTDPICDLFTVHKVNEQKKEFVICPADSYEIACKAQYQYEMKGMTQNTVAAPEVPGKTTYVYVYVITSKTEE